MKRQDSFKTVLHETPTDISHAGVHNLYRTGRSRLSDSIIQEALASTRIRACCRLSRIIFYSLYSERLTRNRLPQNHSTLLHSKPDSRRINPDPESGAAGPLTTLIPRFSLGEEPPYEDHYSSPFCALKRKTHRYQFQLAGVLWKKRGPTICFSRRESAFWKQHSEEFGRLSYNNPRPSILE